VPHLAVAALNLGLKSSLYNLENHDCLTRKGGHPSYLQLIYIHKRGGLKVMNYFFIKKARNTYPRDWYTCATTKINPTMCHDE
jgi:hypothetical protein